MWITELIGLEPGEKSTSPIKTITKPVVTAIEDFAGFFTENVTAIGVSVAVIGLVILFMSLLGLVNKP